MAKWKPQHCTGPVVEPLEERQLFSADLPGAQLIATLQPVAVEQVVADQVGGDQATDALTQADDRPLELVFVDASVPDYQSLIDGLDDGQHRLQVVVIGADQDGLTVIGQTLAGQGEVAAIHILSHGASGEIQLGSETVDSQTLLNRAGVVGTWGDHLSEDADILLYGCDVAADAAGREFVDLLAQLSGADVAASDDLTGNANQGADWDLEYRSGITEAAPVLTTDNLQRWGHVLAISAEPASSAATAGASNSLTFSHTVGSGTNRLLVVEIAGGSKEPVTSVTYGGTPLTKLAEMTQGGNKARTEIWYLLSPTPGTADVIVSMGANKLFVAGATSFTGVDQTSSFGTPVSAEGTGGNPSVTLASASGESVLDVVALRDRDSGSASASQNTLWINTNGNASADAWGGSSTTPGGTSVTTNWTTAGAGGGEWAALAVAIKPAANAAPNDIDLSQTTQVAIANPGFEAQVIADSGSINSTVGVTGWTASAADTVTGVWNPPTSSYNFEAPEGQNVAFVNTSPGGHSLSQTLTETFEANRSYTLSAWVGDELPAGDSAGWEMRLYAGTQLLGKVDNTNYNPADGEFVKATLHLNADALSTYSAQYGQALKIELYNIDTGGSANAHFDDVQLEYTAIGVDQNAPNGTVVADVASVTDPNAGDTFTFSLSNDAGGRFAIDANTGIVTVANGALLDYATNPSHDITIRAADQTGLTYDEVFTIQVRQPLANLPAAQSVNEDNSLVFSSANSNAITVNASGLSGGTPQVSLSVDNGTLSLSQTTGLTFTIGDGTADAGMTFSGSVADINAALEGMSHTPSANYNGPVSLQMTTWEDGALVGSYTFDDTANLGTDSGPGTADNGVVTGAVSASHPVHGQLAAFNAATGDRIDMSGLYGQPTNVTLAAWIDFNGVDPGDVISLGDAVVLRAGDWGAGSDALTGFFYDGSNWNETKITTTLSGAGWHHVAYVFDDVANRQALYLDGIEVASSGFGTSISYTSPAIAGGTLGNSTIGNHADPDEPKFNFDGQIDDARVYDRALSAEEIVSIKNDPPRVENDSLSITVASVNDAPSLSALSQNPTYTENGAPVGLYTFVSPNTFDSGEAQTIEEVKFTVTNVTDGADEQIVLDGSTFSLTDLASGTTATNGYGYAVSLSGTTATVTLTTTGASTADISNLLISLSYQNASEAPSTANRVFTVTSIKDSGGTANGGVDTTNPGLVSTVTVNAVNDAPIAGDDRPALNFDGTDDYVQVASSPSLTMNTNLTMEAWINPDAVNGSEYMVLNKEGEYEFAIKNGTLQWGFTNTSPGWSWYDTGIAIDTGVWTHIAISYDNGVIKTYINGGLADTYSGSGSIGDTYVDMNELRIGGRTNNPAGKYFDGQIADVRVWNVTRGDAQITSTYNSTLTGREAGLVGNWLLDEGTGPLAPDQTPFNNDGTLGGGAATQEPTWVGYRVNEDNVLTVGAASGVLANDSDPDGDALSVNTLPITDVSHGTLTLNADGSFTYTPDANFNGTDAFVYEITDGHGGTAQATVTLTVNAVNDAALAADDSYTVNEDASLDMNWFDTDWTARRTFTLDNSGQSEDLVDFPVLVVLDPNPVTGNIDYAKTQDDGSDLRFFDANGAALDYDIEEWNESGRSYIWVRMPLITAGSTTNSVTMYYGNMAAPSGESAEAVWSNGFESVQHLSNDLLDASSNNNHGVNSGSINALGQVADGQLFDGIDDDINLGSNASIDDIFAGGGTVSAWINPTSWGENGYGRIFDKSDATLPNAGWALEMAQGTSSLLFQQGFSGGIGSWTSAPNSISLNSWQYVTVSYDSSSPGNTPVFYINGTPVATVVDATPSGAAVGDASIDLHLGNFSQSTVRTFDGSIDNIRLSSTVRSADWINAQYLSSTNNFVNFPSGEETAPSVSGVLGNDTDIDHDSQTVSLVSGPGNAAAFSLIKDGTFTYTPNANFNGIDSFTYQTSDGTTNSNVATVTITVTPVNDAPTTTSVTLTAIAEDSGARTITQAELLANATDIEGDALTATALSISSGAGTLVDNGDGTWTYTPAANDDTAVSFSYSITDGTNNTAGSASLDITPVNDAPTTTSVTLTAIAEDSGPRVVTQAELLANATDIEGDALTATALSISSGAGTLVDNGDGTWTYTPAANDDTAVSFSYSITDGTNNTAGSATLDITPFNDAPVIATNTGATVAEGSTSNVITTAMLNEGDVDDAGTGLTYTVTTNVVNGILKVNGTAIGAGGTFTQADVDAGLVTYDHDGSQTSSDSFAFSLADGGEDGAVAATGTFNFTVTNVNDAPVITSASTVGVAENQAGVTTVTSTDVDLDAVTYSLTGGADAARFSIDTNTGVLTFNSAPNFEAPVDANTDGIYEVQVTANDGNGGTDTQLISVTVTDVNEAPVGAVSDNDATADTVAENAAIGDSVGITAAASDPDGTDTVSYSLSNDAGGLFAIDSNTGVISVAGALDYETATSHSVTVLATSTDGSTSNQAFMITVTPATAPVEVTPPPAPLPPMPPAPSPSPSVDELPAPDGGKTDTGEPLPATSSSANPETPAQVGDRPTEILTSTSIASADDTTVARSGSATLTPRYFGAMFGHVYIDLLKAAGVDLSTFDDIDGAPSLDSANQQAVFAALDRLNVELAGSGNEIQGIDNITLAAGGAAISLTTGAILWVLRTGSLAASLLSVMPIWAQIDPLPVLSAGKKLLETDFDLDDTGMPDPRNKVEDLIADGDHTEGRKT